MAVNKGQLEAEVATAGHALKRLVANDQSHASTTADVLKAEYEAIWGPLPPGDDVEAIYRRQVQQHNQAALCLSGGGIRSAAFSLGVLQILARHQLLTQFQYLSTVSGGGYIGGWLSRWIAIDPDQDAATIETKLAMQSEIPEVANLPATSNFLTPRIGITSADTWTGILLWVRNVLLNWTVFVPAMALAVLAANFYFSLLTWLAATEIRSREYDLAVVLLWIASIALTSATAEAVRNIPSHRPGPGLSGKQVGWRIVLPLALWAALVPAVLAAGGYKLGTAVEIFHEPAPILMWLIVFSFVAKIAGYLIAAALSKRNLKLFFTNFPIWIIVAAIASAALWFAIWSIDQLSGGLLELGVKLNASQPAWMAAFILALSILGPLGADLAHLLLSTLYVGFRNAGFLDDDDREWLARLSAVFVFPTALWAVFAAICLSFPYIFFDNEWLTELPWGTTVKRLTEAFGAVSGFVAVLGGTSSTTKPDISTAAPKNGSSQVFEIAVRLATLIFIAFIFAGLALVERRASVQMAMNVQQIEPGFIANAAVQLSMFLAGFVLIYLFWFLSSRKVTVLIGAATAWGFLCAVGLVAGLGSWLAGLADWSLESKILLAHGVIATALFLTVAVSAMKIDVNRVSMHGVYRNRLVRAFLGGARASRAGDPFTSFDASDNLRVSKLGARKDGRRVLYPVINVTLNLVGGQNLAWQERKASSFIITPLYCGSAILGDEAKSNAPANFPRKWTGAYVGTQDYGSNEPDLDDTKPGKKPNTESETTGISLGTAITISGAAASPSMGYHSSPSTAFLMTLFNVRLGAWLANPAAKITKAAVKAGPTSALRPLLTEALGLTDAKSDNVYLSDGGHFENLGVYEMIRRRCRNILVVDADADENFDFEDLARAVRFAAIDLDAKIEFTSIQMKPVRDAKKFSPTFAFGTITYAENPAVRSRLIYLKPTYFLEDAPIDVRSYGAVNSSFPHETTLDQWFGESQFESYRRLGEHLMSRLCDSQLSKPQFSVAARGAGPLTLEQFFTAVAS